MRNFKITVDGNVYDVQVEEIISAGVSAPAMIPVAAPVAAPVKAAPAAAPVAAPVKTANLNGTQIKSPMPGMILNYKVAAGAQVYKGQVVLVLEAMKMENDICAPADGKVTFVAAKGSNVETGDILAVIN